MKIAYFDCFAGASGDMILGALLDAGLTIERLREEISKLHLSHYELDVEKVVK
ncbi:MAG: nickel insertion protein, partial [Desulfobacterales bacterium]